MREPCRITAYKADDERTELKVTVNGDIEEQILRYQKNGTLNGELSIDDGRHISAVQRRKIYANIADIAYYCGEVPEYTSFNPRTPRGVRLVIWENVKNVISVSIHAPLAECDICALT